MKTNVLELIPDLRTGGAQALVRDYARLIDTSDFNLFIATIYPAEFGSNVDLIKQSSAQLVSIFPARNLISRFYNRVFDPFIASIRLLRIIKKYKINVLHVHLGILKYLVPIRHQLHGVKLLYTCHSLPKRFFSGSNSNEFKAARLLIKDNSLQLIALHDEMRKELNQMFGITNTIVIRNGIDFNRFKQVRELKDDIRKSLNIPVNAFLVGHVGRLSLEKNHLFLIDIFNEIHHRAPNSYLLLVGMGPQESVIIEKVRSLNLQSFVIMLSNRSDIPQLMKAMDVFVFPSLFEGLPLSVVEAQVLGLRVVVSNTLTRECFFLPSLITMDLNDAPAEWARVILDNDIAGEYNSDISLFDANNEMRRLEQLYSIDNNIKL